MTQACFSLTVLNTYQYKKTVLVDNSSTCMNNELNWSHLKYAHCLRLLFVSILGVIRKLEEFASFCSDNFLVLPEKLMHGPHLYLPGMYQS